VRRSGDRALSESKQAELVRLRSESTGLADVP
jgi:hypothetical protein